MSLRFTAPLLVLALAGCASVSQAPPASPPAGARQDTDGSPLGSPFGESRSSGVTIGTPLLIDRMDLRLGTTVQYRHIPSASELHDLSLLPGVARVVIALDEWPSEYAPIQVLDQVPEGAQLVVVLPGWPPSRAAAEAWNYLRVPVRIVVVVPGPPPTPESVAELNQMRGLERVIAQMDQPSRSGFERLQRPLGFRKIVE